MTNHNRTIQQRVCRFLTILILSIVFNSEVLAEQDNGLIKALTRKDAIEHIGLCGDDYNLGGWLASGFTFNPLHPRDRSNGTVQFNNWANEFNVHQLGLFAEKTIDRNTLQWQIGGRFEFMFGTDTPNTQATGHWDMQLISQKSLRAYDIALPQAYVEIFAPFSNGIGAKIGHFYSILGYESVPSPPNFFVSHSYSMKSSPFTMSGVLLSYPVNDYLTVQGGAVTGPDNLDRHAGAWSFVGGFNLENQAHSTGFTFSVLDGDVDDTQPSHLLYTYSAFHHDLQPDLHFVLQHDYGRQHNAVGTQTAEWYSIVNYWLYDVNKEWSTGLRAEWFHDDDGARFGFGAGSFYALSLGLNWKPNSWFKLRPEVRYDWADGLKPFDEGQRSGQWLLSIDSVIVF